MGNSPPSLSEPHQPSRPFAPWNKRSCLTASFLPHPALRKAPPLLKLILLQDWQRVLCRVKLYPTELSQYMKFQVTEQHVLKVLPLHLTCALDPPVAVVALLLELYVDAAALPLLPGKKMHHPRPERQPQWGTDETISTIARNDNNKTKRLKLLRWRRRYHEWRRHCKGAFPSISVTDMDEDVFHDAKQQQSVLESQSVYVSAVQSEWKAWTEKDDNDSDPSSSISSSCLTATNKNVVLQLSPSGAKHPMPVVLTQKTDDTMTSETTTSIFRVHWDLHPLFRHVLDHGSLLPLHIACFYSASSPVLEALAKAYPIAALCEVVGMLPIHWIAAGWTLPPLLPPPPLSSSLSQLSSPPKRVGPLPVLRVLQHTVPDSVRVRSGNHGMTPEDYIHECMEDCEYKEACLQALLLKDTNVLENDDGSMSSSSSDESIVFNSDSSSTDLHSKSVRTESASCLSSMVAERDWESILAAVEDDTSIAAKWIYGIDGNTTTIWKRLPIHLACANGAPVGLVYFLLQSYPAGGCSADPHDGSTPLHVACQTPHVPLSVIRLLLEKCPQSTQACSVPERRLPLHMAVLSMASYDVIEALLEVDPSAVAVADSDGKTAMDYAKDLYGETHLVFELLVMVYLFLSKPTL